MQDALHNVFIAATQTSHAASLHSQAHVQSQEGHLARFAWGTLREGCAHRNLQPWARSGSLCAAHRVQVRQRGLQASLRRLRGLPQHRGDHRCTHPPRGHACLNSSPSSSSLSRSGSMTCTRSATGPATAGNCSRRSTSQHPTKAICGRQPMRTHPATIANG